MDLEGRMNALIEENARLAETIAADFGNSSGDS
jgi:hypothetical protein